MCASYKTETFQISVGGQISIWKQYVYTHQQSFVYGLVSPTERRGWLAQEQCCADIASTMLASYFCPALRAECAV